MEADDDYSTDDSSNKRKAAAGAEQFNRSKKTYRTPQKNKGEDEDKLDLLIHMMQDIKSEQSEMRKEIKQNGQEQKRFNSELLKLKQENENIKKENEQIKSENELIRKELQDIRSQLQLIEKNSKKNNIVMNGLSINTEEPVVAVETITKFIKDNLKINVQPKNVTNIGNKICIIELKNAKDKLEIMQNKAKLKQIPDSKVYINEDLTKYEREKQKYIRLRAQEEKNKGKEVKVGYSTLRVDGDIWRWDRKTNRLVKSNSKN